MALDARACLFVLVDKHRLYKSWYRNILLSFSILILSHSGLEFVFLIIIWKFCGNRCPPFPPMQPQLMRSALAAVPSSLSVFFLFLDLSRYLPLSLCSVHLAQNLWRGSGGVSSVLESEEARLPQKASIQDPHVLLHPVCSPFRTQASDLRLFLRVHLASTPDLSYVLSHFWGSMKSNLLFYLNLREQLQLPY